MEIRSSNSAADVIRRFPPSRVVSTALELLKLNDRISLEPLSLKCEAQPPPPSLSRPKEKDIAINRTPFIDR